jgi:hypothetical protein
MRREKKSVSRSSPVSEYTISAVYQRGDRGCRHLVLMRSQSSLHSGVTTSSPISKGLSKVTTLAVRIPLVVHPAAPHPSRVTAGYRPNETFWKREYVNPPACIC